MNGSGMWRCSALVRGAIATLTTLALAPAASAAPPQSDPLNPPTIAVTAMTAFAHGGKHPADGDTFTAQPGTWSGLGNSYSYQWQRCPTTSTSSCVDIAGATAATMTANSLFNQFVRAGVTATNPEGSTTAYTATSATKLVSEAVHRIALDDPPALEGITKEGETLFLNAFTKLTTASLPMTYSAATTSWTWWRYDTKYAGPSDKYVVIDHVGPTYVPTAADVGKYIGVSFSMVNGAGIASTQSVTNNRVGPIAANTDPPSASAAPTLDAPTGAMHGELLQGTRGSWVGAGPQTYAYQWLRCDDAGANCADLPGETLSQYTAGQDDVGARIRLRVTATNKYGSDQAVSDPSAVIAPAPPTGTADPTVSGTAKDGQVLSGTAGAFKGTAPIDSTFAWERCNAQGDHCENLVGASDATYTLTPEDIGRRLRYKQTATNVAGSGSARSTATAVVQAIAPTATVLPTIAGRARDEEPFTSTRGDWTGSPTITYARQWMRCSSAADSGSCSPIALATGAAYTATSADVGSYLRVRVTASNFGNNVPAFSEASAMIAPLAPHAIAAPALSGDAVDGQTLTATLGRWAGTVPQTYARRWERCDAQAQNCIAIDGATAATYQPASADVARRVRVVVVATGPGGTTEASSAATDPIAALAPSSTTAPELSGTARHGETLTATEGAWAGTTPMQRTLQWERCDAQGESCSAITGATGSTYRLAPQDVGRRVRVTVLAVNAGGEQIATSNPSAVVAAVGPANTQLPAVTGTARDEETLTATQGSWSGSPTLTYARQWMRCSSTDGTAGCEAIPGATSLSYKLTDDDVGSFLRLRVTATNPAGSATAHSAPAGDGAAQPAPPAPLGGEGPSATIYAPGSSTPDADQSAPDVGDRLIADPGTWSGTDRPGHEISYAYTWERCTTAGCTPVAGRTAPEMTVTGEDLATQLRAVVTANNPTGTQSQATPRFGVTRGPAAAPTSPAAPESPAPKPEVPAAPGPLALPAGSLLAPASCQTVAKRGLQVRAGAAGKVRLTVPAGAASVLAPLPVTVTIAKPKALGKLTLKVAGRSVKLTKPESRRGKSGKTLTGTIKPQLLVLSPQLQLTAAPRKGKPARASGRLATKDCEALLSVVLQGTKLALRVDQRNPIGAATFTLPKGLALKVAGGRLGQLESLPFGNATKTITTGQVGGNVQLAGRTVTVRPLPAQTATVTLRARLAGKGKKGKSLKFRAATTSSDGAIRALATTVSVRR